MQFCCPLPHHCHCHCHCHVWMGSTWMSTGALAKALNADIPVTFYYGKTDTVKVLSFTVIYITITYVLSLRSYFLTLFHSLSPFLSFVHVLYSPNPLILSKFIRRVIMSVVMQWPMPSSGMGRVNFPVWNWPAKSWLVLRYVLLLLLWRLLFHCSGFIFKTHLGYVMN